MKPSSEQPPRTHKYSNEMGVEKITGKSEAWWKKQNMTVLKEQAELRGKRFSDLDVKGGKTRSGEKIPRMKKEDYLKELLARLQAD